MTEADAQANRLSRHRPGCPGAQRTAANCDRIIAKAYGGRGREFISEMSGYRNRQSSDTGDTESPLWSFKPKAKAKA